MVAKILQFFWFFKDRGCLPSWICRTRIWPTQKEYLVVFIVVRSLVEIDRVVLIICKFSHFAILAWKCLFMPPKWVFEGIAPHKWVIVRRDPQKAHPCTETRHVTLRLSKSVKCLLRYCNFSIFSRWRPSAILDLWNAYLGHPRGELGGLYHCAKFRWHRPSRFGNMQIFLFYYFGLKMPIHVPKMGFWGNLTP